MDMKTSRNGCDTLEDVAESEQKLSLWWQQIDTIRAMKLIYNENYSYLEDYFSLYEHYIRWHSQTEPDVNDFKSILE